MVLSSTVLHLRKPILSLAFKKKKKKRLGALYHLGWLRVARVLCLMSTASNLGVCVVKLCDLAKSLDISGSTI